ncbi:MAG TPA: HAMP domain-containing sensor histidine kinase [Candidatus Cybelea sp.]|nr:HAMP domain-containing sensor histidine kinase [Candidatus Cybelea sp.]
MLDLKRLASFIGERAVLPTVGHELRTPLTSICGYIETVLDGQIDSQTSRRFLEIARLEALRLGRMIDGMLEVSMLDLAPPGLSGLCDVVEQIRATIDIIAPIARKRDVTIRTRSPKRAVARLEADECVHALSNLVENAVKHGSEHGTVKVGCRRAEPFVEVTVEDDGSGVDPADRKAIFKLGVRGANTDRTGSGIGLAVVKAIAERRGGDVRVESSSLGGARFVLRLPAG